MRDIQDNIFIIEKPEWVSWDDIHEVLMIAHAENRAKGIKMRKPSLPGEEIRKELGEEGVMLVAIVDNRLVGTAAMLKKENKSWYNNGAFCYCCFDAVLPEYNGQGIYGKLCDKRIEIARNKGLNNLYVDTHHENTHAINVNLKNGFKCVDIKMLPDHWNVVLFKWLDGCPYTDFRCKFEFVIRKIIMMIKRAVKSVLKIL